MFVSTRKRWTRTGVAVIAVAAAVGGMTPAAMAAADVPAGLADFYSQKLEWAPCANEGELAALQCAVVTVPMNYRKPDAERISVTISKLPAKDPAKRQGVLLLNPGGPGGDGVGLPLAFVDRPIAQAFDMIGFDPRGVGRSTRLMCENSVLVADLPTRPADNQFELFTAQARMDEAACERTAGGLRPYINTPNTARDMDVIRGVLGEKKINYLGFSYGTYLGAVYGSLFGSKLNRNVFDSSVNPDWIWRETFRQQAVAARANIDTYDKWLGERNSVYGLGKSQAEVFATTEALTAKLTAKPIIDPDFGKVDGSMLDALLGWYSRFRPVWDELGDLIKSFKAAADGTLAADSATLKDAGKAARMMYDLAIAETHEGVFETVTCEADWPKDLAFYNDEMKLFRDKYPHFGGVARVAPWNCTFRSFKPADKVTDLKRAGYPTGLVIQADSDAQTAYAGGPAMATKLGDHLVSVADDGMHGLYAYNACASDIIDRYLINGVLPATRVTCAGDPRPDVPADSAETVSQRPAQSTNVTASVQEFLAKKMKANGIF